MSVGLPNFTVSMSIHTSIAVAAEVLGQGSQAALPIVDAQGGLVGMLGAAGLNAVLFHHEALGHIRGDGA